MSQPGEHSTRHLSSFHLEAVRLGAATDEERTWVEAHRASCDRCAALARELEGFRDEFATGSLRARHAVRPAVDVRRPPRRWWNVAAILVPVAAAFLLVAIRWPTGGPAEEEPVVLEKGGPSLGIVVRRGGQVFPARQGASVHPGDQIRFVLRSVTQRYLLIGSVDSSGRANIYVPYDGKESTPVTPGDRLEMEGSIVLDTQLGPERIFALLSSTPLAAEQARRALAAIGAGGPASIRKSAVLDVPAQAQSSVLLEKVAE